MKPMHNNRRQRGRGRNKPNQGFSPNRVYESNGPDMKVRGTAAQVLEKYQTLARDAQSAGDRVMAENYLQHAEHYQRLLNLMQEQIQAEQSAREEERLARQAQEAKDTPADDLAVDENDPSKDGLQAEVEPQDAATAQAPEQTDDQQEPPTTTASVPAQSDEVEAVDGKKEAVQPSTASQDKSLAEEVVKTAPKRRGRPPKKKPELDPSAMEQPQILVPAGE